VKRVLAIAVVVACAAACGGGTAPTSSTASSTSSTAPSTTTTSTPSTTIPDITNAPRPPNVPDDRVSWYDHPAPGGTQVLLGVVRSQLPGPHPAIVLVPGSDGFNSDYVVFAEQLATRGFDVGFGCWWANYPIADESPTSLRIICGDAPPFKGVVDAAVPDLDSLVEGIAHALGGPSQMAVMGFSRGGGIVALRASAGRPEPIISVAGVLEGSAFGVVTGEVNVVERADGVHVPVLLLHGVDDTAVPVAQSQDFEAALRARGADVEAHYYEGQAHGLAQVPWVRTDILDRTAAFLCARFTCGT
jgi:dienelactone hydrolase